MHFLHHEESKILKYIKVKFRTGDARRTEAAEGAGLVEAGGAVEAWLAEALVDVVLAARAAVAVAAARRPPLAVLAMAAVFAHARRAPPAALAARARQPGRARARVTRARRLAAPAVQAGPRRARVGVTLAALPQEPRVTSARPLVAVRRRAQNRARASCATIRLLPNYNLTRSLNIPHC